MYDFFCPRGQQEFTTDCTDWFSWLPDGNRENEGVGGCAGVTNVSPARWRVRDRNESLRDWLRSLIQRVALVINVSSLRDS